MSKPSPAPTRATRLIVLALLAGVLSLCAHAAGGANPPAAIVKQCTADLAKRLGVAADKVKFADAYATKWRDASLGLPEPGKMYAQVLTPGWQILVEGRGLIHLYTANARRIRYGGPVELWKQSMLYLQPIENEPNLNCELWQCSLIGTNAVKIATGVSEVYPQAKGAILATRRTSRSGFDLLYVKAGEEGGPRTVARAFAFGAAALTEAQDTWAAIVKPGLGATWEVWVGGMDAGDVKKLALPEGWASQPWLARMQWRDAKLVALVSNAERKGCFETTPSAEKPVWEAAGSYYPPLSWNPLMLLNKSFSLVIGQAPISSPGLFDGFIEELETPKPKPPADPSKPKVEIGERHFLGSVRIIATVPDLTLGGYDLIGATEADHTRFAFIRGTVGDKQAAYSVDYVSGQVLPSFLGEPNGQEKPMLFDSPCLIDPLPIISHVEPVFTPQ